jgi:rhodanese-related sulfurtransferase
VIIWILSLIFILFFIPPKPVNAVLPPDFIFNVTTQIIQSFSIALIFLSVTFGSAYKFFKLKYTQFRLNKILIPIILALIVIISILSARIYGSYIQKVEYDKWLKDSQNQLPANNNGNLETLIKLNQLDNLKIGQSEVGDQNQQAFSNDPNAQFIKDYYNNISQKNYDKAYEVSKKSVDFNTFKSWYQNTDRIIIDKIIRIDEKKSSLELTLKEGELVTRYGVLMTLVIENKKPVRIENSEVKVLGNNTNKPQNNYSFFDSNSRLNLSVTNEEFKQIIKNGKEKITLLDARENIEYENGYLPGSTHIRFADLKAGRWIELSGDKITYVLCWSGIRGKEVAEFLRTKKIVARYLENGANGWVSFGGEWFGDIKFSEKYNEYRFQKVFSTSETRDEVKNGTILVDSRQPDKYNQSHVPASINIPTMYIPSIQYNDVLGQIPANSKIIAICDDYVNCFDAKVTGVELEKRGHTFLGRYNKPWEYGK